MVDQNVRLQLDKGSSSVSFGDMPAEALAAARKRLLFAVGMVGSIYALYLALFTFVFPEYKSDFARVVSLIVIADCIGFAYFIRKTKDDVRTLAQLAIAWGIVLAFSVSLVDHWDPPFNDAPLRQISWGCAGLLFLPTLVPAPSRYHAVGAFGSAIAIVIAFFVAYEIQGLSYPNSAVLTSVFLPPFICASMAYGASCVLEQMGMDMMRARRLGSYELTELLGKGGMGEVWKARHRMLARPAAVKLIRPDKLGDSAQMLSRKVRFEREAKVTAALESPHSVGLYDFGVTADGAFYYAMELLNGVDLETLVDRFGPLPAERVVNLLLQACDSLDDAHGNGLVHRDIKPANIFVSRKARRFDFVSVLDFGLVKLNESGTQDAKLTQEGSVSGTPAYCAPEMAMGGDVDGRADLYSLGCVGYYLLTGELVFNEPTPVSMLVAHATKDVDRPSARTELPIPSDLEDVLMRCLNKDPSQRYADANELATALRALPCGSSWTRERAERWWLQHLPEQARRSASDMIATSTSTSIQLEAA